MNIDSGFGKMKAKLFLKSAAGMLACILAQGIAAGAEYALHVQTCKPEALYAVGEKIVFSVMLTADGAPLPGQTVNYAITRNGRRDPVRGAITSAVTPASIATVMDNPGFALCAATFTAPTGQTVRGLAGAGAAPLEIKPGLELHDEFDRFWDAQKAALEKLPLEFSLEPVPAPAGYAGKVECFDIKVNCPGAKPVSGYLAKPVQTVKASLPAIVTYHGAGVRSAKIELACSWAEKGMLALDINAHGIANGQPPEFYDRLNTTDLKGYPHLNKGDREKCYFLGMFQRVYRSLQFIKKQPEWDGKCLVTRGSSQGGGQSIAAAGLDSQVTFCAALVPALCDHYGYLAGRANGWPRLIAVDQSGQPAQVDVVAAAKYFDGVNFAARIRAEAIFTAGLIDNTCCPSSVYSAYNCVPGRKAIFNNPRFGHHNPPEAEQAVDQAIDAHVWAMRARK